MTESLHGAQLAGTTSNWPAADLAADCSADAAVILALDWSDEPVDVRPDNLSPQEMIFIPFEEDDENVGVPRPLKTHDGQTFVVRAIEAAKQAGVSSITVVVPNGERRLDRCLKDAGVSIKRLPKRAPAQPGPRTGRRRTAAAAGGPRIRPGVVPARGRGGPQLNRTRHTPFPS